MHFALGCKATPSSSVRPISRNSPVALRGVKVLKALLGKSETPKSRKRKRVETTTAAAHLGECADNDHTSRIVTLFV